MDLIEVVLKREDIPCLRFDGSMDIKKRQAAVAEFNSPSRRPKTFILSLKAGGVGLNVRFIPKIMFIISKLIDI